MTTHSLLLLPGDGIGVETIAEVERLIAFFNAKSNTARFHVERDLVGGAAYDAHGVAVTDEAMELLCAYEWPGNVRELESVIQQLVTFSGRFVFREDVLRHINVANPQHRKVNLPFWSAMNSLRRDEWPSIRDLRNWYVTQAYLYFGQESVVARYLGMDARTVSTILEEVAESNESLRGVIDSDDKE